MLELVSAAGRPRLISEEADLEEEMIDVSMVLDDGQRTAGATLKFQGPMALGFAIPSCRRLSLRALPDRVSLPAH